MQFAVKSFSANANPLANFFKCYMKAHEDQPILTKDYSEVSGTYKLSANMTVKGYGKRNVNYFKTVNQWLSNWVRGPFGVRKAILIGDRVTTDVL